MNRRRWAFAAPLLFLLMAAACGGDDVEKIEWSADLGSEDSTLRTVEGDGEDAVYGWNHLAGETVINGETVEVEMLGTVDYAAGEGPIGGFITLTFPSGDTLGMSMEGDAEIPGETTRTEFTSTVTVIGGTGVYAGATGDGEWSGYRDQGLGTTVHMEAEVNVSLD